MLATRRSLGLGMGKSTWLDSDPEVLSLLVTASYGRKVIVATNLAVGYRPLPQLALTKGAKVLLQTSTIISEDAAPSVEDSGIGPGQTLWIEI